MQPSVWLRTSKIRLKSVQIGTHFEALEVTEIRRFSKTGRIDPRLWSLNGNVLGQAVGWNEKSGEDLLQAGSQSMALVRSRESPQGVASGGLPVPSRLLANAIALRVS
jgi:hypothetical protein